MSETGATPEQKEFPDPAGMTLWDIAQAIAINSDIATHLFYKHSDTDDEQAANRAKAAIYYDRRNDLVAEIRDRERAVIGGAE